MDLDDEYLDEYDYYNEEDDEDDVGFWNNPAPSQGTYCGLRPSFLFSPDYSLPSPKYITQEEADQNAKELLAEEEREKEKADKKRLKKKRQKDRKRQQKVQEAENGTTPLEEKTVTRTPDSNGSAGKVNNEDAAQEDSSASASDEDLDLRSTFVRQAQKKMESKPKPERRERAKEPSREGAQEQCQERGGAQERIGTQPPPPPPQNNINILDRFRIQESLDLANIGNNMASRERFSEALHYYTEAIKLNPSEYRFLGNRSYVYDHLGRYEEALADAENALKLQSHFLKGHFRKGKALKGLKRYLEAVSAFQQVLLFDVNHVEAAREIVQCQQRMQEATAFTRVKILGTAPLCPLPPPPACVPGLNNKVFVPRNIYRTTFDANKSAAVTAAPAPEGASSIVVHSKLYPIWVGNVSNRITETGLRQKFQPFGIIHSVRMLYSRTCAFVNFTNKEAAEAAFCALQGLMVEGSALVLQLRNPEHNAAGGRKIGK